MQKIDKTLEEIGDVKIFDIIKPEGGFFFIDKKDFINLDNSTLYHSVLKTNRFITENFIHNLVKVTFGVKDDKYYLSANYPILNILDIYELNIDVERELINNIKKKINKYKFLKQTKIDEKISDLINEKLSDMAGFGQKIENIKSEFLEFKVHLETPFFAEIVFIQGEFELNNNKYNIRYSIQVESLSGEVFLAEMFYANTIMEIDRDITMYKEIMINKIKDVKLKKTLEELT